MFSRLAITAVAILIVVLLVICWCVGQLLEMFRDEPHDGGPWFTP